MQGEVKGHLFIIGGAEDKSGDCVILRKACSMLREQELFTILTTATEEPEVVGNEYKAVFSTLGLKSIQVLNINTRDDANNAEVCEQLSKSKCLFFTGGDQLRITSILGGTSSYHIIQQLYRDGGMIMGTSAGASVMSSTMIVKGEDNEPARKCTLKMAPGLDLLNNAIIDQHFDQRGRFGRLLTGVAENPDVLGIGIDEDTAILVYPDMHFEVFGSNAVTLIDGCAIKSSNVSELAQHELLAVVGVTVHAIPQNYGFNLQNRTVLRMKSGE